MNEQKTCADCLKYRAEIAKQLKRIGDILAEINDTDYDDKYKW